MSPRKALASLAAFVLLAAGIAATPVLAEDGEDSEFWLTDDTGLLLTAGAIATNILVMTIWATEDNDIEIIPDPEPTPVSP